MADSLPKGNGDVQVVDISESVHTSSFGLEPSQAAEAGSRKEGDRANNSAASGEDKEKKKKKKKKKDGDGDEEQDLEEENENASKGRENVRKKDDDGRS